MQRLDPRLVAEPAGQKAGLVALDEPGVAGYVGEEGTGGEGIGVAVEGEAVDADAFVFGVEAHYAVGVEELGAVDYDRGC